MDEKSLLMYWADKNHNAAITSAEMESYFGSSVPSHSWVGKWLRALKRGEDIFEPCERSGRPQDRLTGPRVLEFPNSTPLVSVRQIATATKVPRSSGLDRLNGCGYIIPHLKSILHHITTALMKQRVEFSRELLVMLGSAKHRGWTHFLTGDEWRFWLTIDYEQQWLPPGAERPTRLRKTISSPKTMIIIFWSPLGFPVIQALPRKVTFTSKFFVDAILPYIVAAKPAGDSGRRMVLHRVDEKAVDDEKPVDTCFFERTVLSFETRCSRRDYK
jgi:hypothetical protein